MFVTVRNTPLPQFISPILEPLDSGGQCKHSAVPLAQQSHSETTCHAGGLIDPNSPLVVITALAPTPNSTVSGSFSVPPRTVVTTGMHVHLGRRVVPSAHMGALLCSIIEQQHFQKVPRLATAPRSW